VSYCIAIAFDAILGQDFLDIKRARIDFANRVIQMSNLEVEFDDKMYIHIPGEEMQMYIKILPQSETIIEVPTSRDAGMSGVITKEEPVFI
jgi:hypothetical protein